MIPATPLSWGLQWALAAAPAVAILQGAAPRARAGWALLALAGIVAVWAQVAGAGAPGVRVVAPMGG
jgi:hypothetical protein